MLNILGPGSRFCDGVSRRSFLSIGSLAMGGMGLREMLAAESVQGVSRPHKATIMILLPGGPPHQDMVDLKPTAPKEIRGPFQPIRTNVPGIDITEMFPLQAQHADKFSIVRSLHHDTGGHFHGGHFMLTTKSLGPNNTGTFPSIGSIVART